MGNRRLLIVGDLFSFPSNLERFINADVKNLFGEKILEIFGFADCRVCNLEGALTSGDERREKTGPVITAPISIINTYKGLGIDYCLLANNHITDAGNQGVSDTLSALNNAGVKYCGAGINAELIQKYVTIVLGERKICLYNVAETMYNAPTSQMAGAHLYDEYVVCNDLKELKTSHDYIIVVYHGGIENYRFPSPETRKRFHRMVDCGADAVIAQHTHCIGCEEYYNGSYLQYGQGNFLFKNVLPGYSDSGLMLEFIFDNDGVQIEKHLVRAEGDFVRYDCNQDFTEYNNRSNQLSDAAFLEAAFDQFCYSELHKYIRAFRGNDLIKRIWRKLHPRQDQMDFYNKEYSRQQLLFILHTLRSEQNRETAIVGIKKMLSMNK